MAKLTEEELLFRKVEEKVKEGDIRIWSDCGW